MKCKVRRIDTLPASHQHCALYRMVQFTHVTRPRVLQHHLKCSRLNSLDLPAISRRMSSQEVSGKCGYIFTPLAQRRKMNLYRVETK
jgi:hypothetical protein